MTMDRRNRLRTEEPQRSRYTLSVKGYAPLRSRRAVCWNRVETRIYSTWRKCARIRERRLSGRVVLGHESKCNGIASYGLNTGRRECQGLILPHYDRVNGALVAVGTFGGGRGGGRIASRIFSSGLVLRKSLGR